LNNLIQPKSHEKMVTKIGLIGCGRAAEINYLSALKKFPDFKVVAVVDPIKERRELLSRKLNNCIRYSSIETTSTSGGLGFFDQIDVGIITSPPNTHILLASELLKWDKYVLVEKPLAPSTEGIKELISIESSSKASLMMGFNCRYWKPVIDLKGKLLKKQKIYLVEMIFTSNYSKWKPVSFTSDPLDDLGPHVFDLIRYIFNKDIVSISANNSGIDELKVKIKIPEENQILCRIAHCRESIRSIKVVSKAEKYLITLKSERISSGYKNVAKLIDLADRVKRKIQRKASPIKNTYEEQLKSFFNYIRLNRPPYPNIKDGVKAILAVEAARESIRNNGREISLNEIK